MKHPNSRTAYVTPPHWAGLDIIASDNNLLDSKGHLSKSGAIAWLIDTYMDNKTATTAQPNERPAVERKDK